MKTNTIRNCIILNNLAYRFFPIPIRSIIRKNLNLTNYLKVSYTNLRYIKSLKIQRINGKFIWCFDDWSYGYFHWVFDVLPKIVTISEKYNVKRILIPETVSKNGFVRSILNDLDIEFTTLCSGTIYKADSIITCESFPYYNKISLIKIRDLFYKKYDISSLKTGYRRIYISRAKAARRRIVNENEIVPIILKYGFEIVYLEEMSFREQVKLFSQSLAIVGLHGAGLSNILFSPSSAKVCEIRSRGFENDVFEKLSLTLDMEFKTLEIDSDSSVMLTNDYIIDITSFDKLMSDMSK